MKATKLRKYVGPNDSDGSKAPRIFLGVDTSNASSEVHTCKSVVERLPGCEFLSPATVVNLHAVSPCLLSARSPPVNLNKINVHYVLLQLWRV